MKAQTGIVMKIEKNTAVVMKNGGEFVSLPANRSWKTGEVILLPEKRRSLRPCYTAAACLALVFTLGAGSFHYYYAQTSLVSIDVNPSIELGINRFNRVVETRALNPEGEQILAEQNLKNLPWQEAVDTIMGAEEMEGYFNSASDIVVTVYAKTADTQESMLKEVRQYVDTASAEYPALQSECHAVDEDTVSQAHDYGVTPGKYLYLQELKETDPDVDITDYTHHSIEELQGQIDACESHGEGTGHEEHNNHADTGETTTSPNDGQNSHHSEDSSDGQENHHHE